jgi:hypothetical protein
MGTSIYRAISMLVLRTGTTRETMGVRARALRWWWWVMLVALQVVDGCGVCGEKTGVS